MSRYYAPKSSTRQGDQMTHTQAAVDPLSPEELRKISPLDSTPNLIQESDVFAVEPRVSSLASALAKAKLAFQPITKNKEVTVRPRDTSKAAYTFSYATLDAILAAVTPVLAERGISLVQNTGWDEKGVMYVSTTLIHESGESATLASIPVIVREGHNAQELGSALTYSQRYSIRLALCLGTEDDDDGNLASGNETETQSERPVPPRGQAEAITSKIMGCSTLEQLQSYWTSLTEAERVAHASVKDLRKSQISRK